MIDRTLAAILAPLDALARWTVAACMGVMAAVVSARVVARYVLNSSIDWADEVSRLAFIWSIFIAKALGVREGVHVGIDLAVERLRPALRDPLRRATSLLSAALLTIVAAQTVAVAQVTWSERMGALRRARPPF